MNPDRIISTSLVCVFVFKVSIWAIIWAIPGLNFSVGGVMVSLIAGLCFYQGITTLADEFTGQKTIRVSTRRGEKKIKREDRFDYNSGIIGAFLFTILGALFLLIAW